MKATVMLSAVAGKFNHDIVHMNINGEYFASKDNAQGCEN